MGIVCIQDDTDERGVGLTVEEYKERIKNMLEGLNSTDTKFIKQIYTIIQLHVDSKGKGRR